jgi:hypothetical protein
MKKLPKVLEAMNDLEELPREQLEELIGSFSQDDVADKDYVDSDTGEIVWEKGVRLGDSNLWNDLHPQPKSWGEDDLGDEEPEEAETEEDNTNYHDQLDALVDEFASTWEGLAPDLGDVKPEDAAPDAAESFFVTKPEWRNIAARIGMSRNAVREMVADAVYNALTRGAGQNESVLRSFVREVIAG